MYVWQVIFKEQLSPKKLGFLDVTELVGALSDILHVEIREGEQDLLVFDVDMKPTPSGGLSHSIMQTWFVIVLYGQWGIKRIDYIISFVVITSTKQIT